MSVFHNSMLLGPSGGAAEFDTTLIPKSIWVDGANDFLSKTPGAGGTTTRWIVSCWVQRTEFGFQTAVAHTIFSAGTSTSNLSWIRFDDKDRLDFAVYQGATTARKTSNAVHKDIGWYHICVSFDSGDDVVADRIKLFVNGIEVTSLSDSVNTPDDETSAFNANVVQEIGRYSFIGGQYYEGYITQFTMLENKSFQNSDLSITDLLDSFTFGTSGSQFVPKADADIAALASTAGGNSFCFDFADSSALGTDASSAGNDFALNSIAAANQSTHTPSRTYMQLNPLNKFGTTALSEGNTRVGVDVYDAIRGTKFASSGKKYLEVTINTVNNTYIGVANNSATPTSFASLNVACLQKGGDIYINDGIPSGTNGSSHAFVDDDVVGILIDADNKKFWQSINGQINSLDRTPDIDLSDSDVIAGTGGFDLTSLAGDDGFYTIHIANSDGTSADVSVNTGHKAFAHTPPEGYTDWGSDNYTAPDHQGIDYFNQLNYTGNGEDIADAGLAVTGVGFKPDWIWIKNEDTSDDHSWYDSVRGVEKQIESNTATAETAQSEGVTAFGTDGFTVGSLAQVNTDSETYMSWHWLASNSSSTTSPAGSLASTSSVSDAGHFSIVTYTGTGSATTVGHGLGAAPEMIIVKNRDASDTWRILHHKIASDFQTDHIVFAPRSSFVDDATSWNDTAPTASVFSIGTSVATNTNTEKYVAYCFRSVPGVCRVGGFIGNANIDGPYLSFGFKPAWFMFKQVPEVHYSWSIFDTHRDPQNLIITGGAGSGDEFIHPDLTSAASRSSGSLVGVDWLSDGLVIHSTHDGSNGNGDQHIYLAMADIGGNGTLPPIYGF